MKKLIALFLVLCLSLQPIVCAASQERHHIILSNADENLGSVTADRTEAAAGETVDLVVTLAQGAELDTLSVRDADGREAEGRFLAADEEGRLHFAVVMPHSDLFVEVRFFGNAAHGIRVTVLGGGSAWADADCGVEGDLVALSCRARPGFRLAAVSGAQVLYEDGRGTFLVSMPDGALHLQVLFLKENHPCCISPEMW